MCKFSATACFLNMLLLDAYFKCHPWCYLNKQVLCWTAQETVELEQCAKQRH